MPGHNVQLSQLLKNEQPKTILKEIKKIFTYHYAARSFNVIQKCFSETCLLFSGKFPGYRSCNTEYHDLGHSMEASLAAARLLDGYILASAPVSENVAKNLILAAILHDTGYIQEIDDTEGTGAKYTARHVDRSVAFATKHNRRMDIPDSDSIKIAKIIQCTGITADVDAISFDSPDERVAGCIMGTADLMGQMSNRAYLEKLLFLYYEFREAQIPGFNTEFDILRKTVDFYEITKTRLAGPLMSVFEYAREHFRVRHRTDHNLYVEAIERHIAYLHSIIEDDTTNFRHKLKRGDWVHDKKFSQLS